MAVRLDPRDPRCPECDGPISATATYCMHCYTDFETTDATSIGPEGLGRLTDSSTPSADAGGLLAPDGFLDDSLTATVGLVAGLVVGLLTLVTVLLLTRSLWSLPLVLVVWLGVSAHLVRRRTVNGAVRGGCYAVAVALVLVAVGDVVGKRARRSAA